MNYGATAHGRKPFRHCKNMIVARQPFAAMPVNIIDSIVITEEIDTNVILAQWAAFDPSITVLSELTATQAVKLFINWSDRNGAVNLLTGDYFTFVVPSVFAYQYVVDVSDAPITDDVGEVVATYSIYDNSDNMKEVRITFTDYVENHTDIFGDFWMLLFVGSVASTEQKTLEFVINNNLATQGVVTVNPNLGAIVPRDRKSGFSSPGASAGGYYIFEWIVHFNMTQNNVNGFKSLENFSFEDIIFAQSPHIFLTDAIRQELGIPPTAYKTEIGEYVGADSYPPAERYQVFYDHYNSTGSDNWYDYINWHTLDSGLTTTGIGGGSGLHVTNIEIGDKIYSASLGSITRPTIIRYYTIATIKMTESALGDSEVVGLFDETFRGSYGDDLNASLLLYRFEAGGSAQGISGDYSFSFSKVNTAGAALPNAMFSLFTSEDFTLGADRFVFSGGDGLASFNQLPEGTFYFQETTPPYGYLPDETVYKVVLSAAGYEIYYGPNFEFRLSDLDNKITDISEFDVQPAVVILTGRKNLTGGSLAEGMFSYEVKDADANVVATGANNADGSIQFSSIEFDEAGVYTFTVEEVVVPESGIVYDATIFSVTVTVTNDGNGNLIADEVYPDGGIVFNNRITLAPVFVTLTGRKYLRCKTLEAGMFSFIVKDANANIVATGTNDANGDIQLSAIALDAQGEYIFTVEEVIATQSGIIYDTSVFSVRVVVTSDANGALIASVFYPDGGIVFNNSYAKKPEKPCQPCVPCCTPCCVPCGKPGFAPRRK